MLPNLNVWPQSRYCGTFYTSQARALIILQDVADQVRVLATTKSMTGQNLIVDSGLTL